MSLLNRIANAFRYIRSGGTYSLNNPNLNLNDPKVWGEVFGDEFRTETGDTVTSAKALSYAPVWQAVSLISGDIAKLPLDLYERRPDLGDNARMKVENDISFLVNREPNEEVTAVKFWRRVMIHALIWDKSWIHVLPNGAGGPGALVQLLPDRTHYERLPDGRMIVVTESNGQLHPLDKESVLCIEWIHDGTNKCSLLNMARNSWALGLAQEKFASKFFKNGGRVGGILELPAAMQKTARDTVEEGFRKGYEGTDNPFKTVILRDNAKFHAAQQSPQDSQLVEATVAQVEQVARWFNLPPNKLNVKGSSSYNSEEQQNQAYLDQTLAIWLKMIADECTAKLLTPKQKETMFFEHNTGALLRMDLLKRYQAYSVAIASRIMNPNECRAKENLLPYEGGDKFENPNTSAPMAEPDANDTGEPADENDPAEGDTAKASMRRLVFGITGQSRQKARNPKAFIEWIDGGLQSHRVNATQLGIEIQKVDEVLALLRAIADTATADDLYSAVDNLATKLELET